MTKPYEQKSRGQKQYATIHNNNAGYVDAGPTTKLYRTVKIAWNELEFACAMLDGEHVAANYARMGLAAKHAVVLAQLKSLRDAVGALKEAE